MNIGIITGASSGMGKEFVKLTMQNHLDLDEIWVIARRKERLEAWPSLYKEQKFRILPLDLQKKEDVECLKQILEETQPHIELFVHCAGFGIMGKIQDISMEEQAEMVDVNCRSVVEISSLLLPYMKYRGRMIYMASAAAFLPQPGFAVYAAGMIGFVGLIIPHVMRMFLGPDHKKLIPASALVGAIFLVICDGLCRIIIPHTELPIGILISMIGAPCFIYLMIKRTYGFGGND